MSNKVEKFTQGEGEAEETLCWFLCPGCGSQHAVRVKGNTPPVWSWNGSLEAPTFTPSLLAQGSDRKGNAYVCHSFVTDGRIQFLGDCTHDKAGQTIDLPDMKEAP
jgi:hypothetical protein